MSKEERGFSFDKEFGREFEPVEETVVLSDVLIKAVERFAPDDPNITKEHRLLVVEPNGEEWAYPIHGELMIGRAPDNHIVVKDRSVSRRHLAVNTDGTHYWFKDLGSGNGTQVNGEYLDEGWLTGGEEIVIGNTKIYFLKPDIEPPKELIEGEKEEEKGEGEKEGEGEAEGEKEKAGSSNLALIFTFVFIGLASVGALGFFGYRYYLSLEREAQLKEQMAKASKLIDRGKKFLKEKKWKEADSNLREAIALLTADDPLHQVAVKYLDIAAKELKANKIYERAESLYLDEDNPKKALELLKKVPKDTESYKKARKLRKKIWKKDLEPLVKEAKLFLAVNKESEAIEVLKKALKIEPKFEEAKKLLEEIKAGKFKKEEKTQEKKPSSSGRSSIGRAKFREGLNLYRAGKYARAIIFFRRLESNLASRRLRRKARKYRRLIKQFKDKFSAGKRAARYGQLDWAIRHFSQALSADRFLGGAHRSKIAPTLSNLLTKRGEKLLRSGRITRAARDLKRALSLNRNNSKARNLLRSLRGKAKGMIEEAEVLIDVDKGAAKERLLKAKMILPPSDPLYSKAVNLLKKLD